MNRYLILIVVIFLGTCTRLIAQENIQTVRDKEIQKLLGMTKSEYTEFAKGIKNFNKRQVDILLNKQMDESTRNTALKKLQTERTNHLKKFLSEEQKMKLADFEKGGEDAKKLHYNRLREQESKKLTEKNIKVQQS